MRLVFLGPPGAGKGTQAKLLREHFRISHISTGDMIRERMAGGTPTGRRAKPFVDAGELVPDPIMVEMVSERLGEPDCDTGFLLDGFPRTSAQAAALDRSLAAMGKQLDAVLLLTADDGEVVRRLSGRRTCGNVACGANYHVEWLPPKSPGRCDRCGEPLLQRPDDQAETIRRRLSIYHKQTAEVGQYYGEKGILRQVSGTGTVDEVHKRILKTLGV
jgi:adenylate kinase